MVLPSLTLFSLLIIVFLFLGVRSENAAPSPLPSSANDSGTSGEGAGTGPEAEWINAPWFRDPEDLLLVVDRQSALPADYAPPDLVDLNDNGIPANKQGLVVRRVIIADLRALFNAGREAGHRYLVFSAYRSYETQRRTYQYWVNTLGREEADRSSALPGHSEHQLGTTLDITAAGLEGDVFDVFGGSAPGRWLAANAFRYGFVMSYPPGTEAITGYIHEPWHFRYVGREVAAIIHKEGMVPSLFIRKIADLKSDTR